MTFRGADASAGLKNIRNVRGVSVQYEYLPRSREKERKFPEKRSAYLLICTTFAGGNPLKYVDEAWE